VREAARRADAITAAATVSERTRSAIEREPAQLVAKPLVIEHELPDIVGQLVALPRALSATSIVTLAFGRRRPGGLDRVGRSTQLVAATCPTAAA
jgi:hypothetical protein